MIHLLLSEETTAERKESKERKKSNERRRVLAVLGVRNRKGSLNSI